MTSPRSRSRRRTGCLFTLTGKGNGATVRIKGGKVRISVRGKVKASAKCSGTVFLTVKKGKTLLSARTAKLSSKCRFSKTLNLSRAKVAKTKKLAVTVRFSGNTVLKAASQNMTVRVPR
jgi:hypothetical protein